WSRLGPFGPGDFRPGASTIPATPASLRSFRGRREVKGGAASDRRRLSPTSYRPSVRSVWRRRADSNRRIKVLQTSPLTTWVRRRSRGRILPQPDGRDSARGVSVVADQTGHDALNRDVASVEGQGLHRRVRRLETDTLAFGVVALQGRLAAHERHDGLPALGLLSPGDDDEVAVEDPVLDHRLAAHPQHEMVALPQKRRRNLDRLFLRERL